ncbi:asparagine synthase-related protein [Snuella lapsa]|uniref:asparagine synthase-related protein n=1 Tax=Snuella lapsa TaxID=870481 RepID=UPI0031F05243
MKTLKTDIIPKRPTGIKVAAPHELDLKAICCFVATGFFLDSDTYWQDEKVLAPGCIHIIDDTGTLQGSEAYFEWHSSPRNLPFNQALDAFSELFENIVTEQTQGHRVILPLSGGLDSRTQAVALRNHASVNTFSYAFKNGYPETKIAKQIAQQLGMPFRSFEIQPGYLWTCIDALAKINGCYSEFTHPRQMAVINTIGSMGDLFSLGHMGDLLFDTMGLPQLNFDEEVSLIQERFVKKGGYELGALLWTSWGLIGDFDAYLKLRLSEMLSKITIGDTNAKLRAFKSRYAVTRWSSNNLSVFESAAPIALPYYDNRMYDFVCSLPEAYLSNRRLQIAYIKRHAPALAKITWQAQRPYNLYNYSRNRPPYNLPYRLFNKSKRILKGALNRPYVMRNWELQFVGEANDKHLKHHLFDSGLDTLVPLAHIELIYKKFKTHDAVCYSHPVSMLLTLAMFNNLFNK